MKRPLLWAVGLVTVLGSVAFSASPPAAGKVSRAEMLASGCYGCHGPDGKSPGIMPALAGKSPRYLVKALKEFRSGERSSTVMGRHAKGYSDEEIALIAKFFSKK